MLTQAFAGVAAALVGATVARVVVRRLSAAPPPSARAAVLIAGAAAAVVALLSSSASPAGLWLADQTLIAGFVLVVTWLGSRSGRWSWLAAAALAAVGAGADLTALALAFAATGVALGSGWSADHTPGLSLKLRFRRRSRRRGGVLGALAGALVAPALLRLSWPEPTGATMLVAAAGAGVLAFSAWPRLRPREKRRTMAIVGIATVAALTATAAWALAVLAARTELEGAARNAERGASAALTGDTILAGRLLNTALEDLDSAEARLGTWWTRAARAVPAVGHNAAALDEFVESARSVVGAAGAALEAASSETLVPSQGAWDLGSFRTLERTLSDVVLTLSAVPSRLENVESPMLAPPLGSRIDELSSVSARAARTAGQALEVTRLLPGIAGNERPRRWLVIVQNPAELRGNGGFVGSFGVLQAEAGRVQLGEFERISALYRDEPYVVGGPEDYRNHWAQRYALDIYPQNLTASPHFPSVAEAFASVVAQSGRPAIDGVIAVDPVGLAALLQLTGPVTVRGRPEAISSANAERILLHEQYLDPQAPGRVDFLESTTREVFGRLISGTDLTPGQIVDALGPAVEAKRIQLHSFTDAEQALFERMGADAAMAPVADDALGVVTQNASQSKIDWFLRRELDYNVVLDPATGRATATVEVRLRNEAPADLPGNYFGGNRFPEDPPGASRMLVSLYTVLDLDSMSVDGEPVVPDPAREQGRNSLDKWVTVLAGQTAAVRYELRGQLPVGVRYRLDVHRQPTVAPDKVSVGLRLTGGSYVVDRDSWKFDLDSDRTLRAGLRDRSGR